MHQAAPTMTVGGLKVVAVLPRCPFKAVPLLLAHQAMAEHVTGNAISAGEAKLQQTPTFSTASRRVPGCSLHGQKLPCLCTRCVHSRIQWYCKI